MFALYILLSFCAKLGLCPFGLISSFWFGAICYILLSQLASLVGAAICKYFAFDNFNENQRQLNPGGTFLKNS